MFGFLPGNPASNKLPGGLAAALSSLTSVVSLLVASSSCCGSPNNRSLSVINGYIYYLMGASTELVQLVYIPALPSGTSLECLQWRGTGGIKHVLITRC
jgi:hypothetical protein